MEVKIRPYQPGDREAVRTIAADTAFFGEPVEIFLDGRELFCDLVYAYYTDVEPEHGWIADADGAVVGFLMGCVDTAARAGTWMRHVLPLVLRRAMAGDYQLEQRTLNYAIAVMGAGIQQEQPQVELDLYPAHLHVNVDVAWRGHGLGRRLITAYLDQLRSLRVPGVHLQTTDQNQAACHLYEKMGFQLLDARPTRLWQHLQLRQEPVENRIYGMLLS